MSQGLIVLLQFLEDLAHLEPDTCLIWSYFLQASHSSQLVHVLG